MKKKGLIIVLLILLLGIGLFTLTCCVEKKLKSISLSVDKLISINETKEIRVEYYPESIKEEITWSSSNEEIASVSNGIIYFLISYYNESKECLEVVKILLDPLP